jgi:hypothetical protein
LIECVGCIGGVIRGMKNIQLTSRAADTKVLIALLCVGSAAIMGLCVPPPQSALGDGWMCVFDGTICAILAILVWATFHLCNLQRLNGLPFGTAIIGSTICWLLLAIGLMILIRSAVADNLVELTTAILMKH